MTRNKQDKPSAPRFKIIVLKKTWIPIASILLTFILGLILNNLYQAGYQHHQTTAFDKIHNLASAIDTRWYQNKTMQSLPVPQTPHSVSLFKQAPTFSPDDLKAMRVPLSDHQLKSDQINETNTTAIALGSTTDQNMQGEKKAFIQINDRAAINDYLQSNVHDPINPFELQAGSIIPGALISGINSDLPGQITAQVRSNVYDSVSGNYLLIPQGSRLTGLYDSQVAYGQKRILIVWNRIIFPNGQSIDLHGMPGVDMRGYAGFHDQVNNHFMRLFGSVILMSLLGTGAQLAAPQNDNPFAPPTVAQAAAQSLNSTLTNVGSSIIAKNLNIQPNLQIRPGYEFNITVTKDMVFPHAYQTA